MFEKEICCWWVSNNAWLAMQTGCFKLGKHFKLPSFMKYVYLLIHMFFHLFFIYLHATYLFVVSLGTKSCFMFCCFVIWSVFDYIFGKQVYNHFDPSWPRKKQYIPLSNMINFSLQLFQLTEACFRLWIVFVTSIVIYLSLYFDVIVCIGVFKI